MPKPQLRHISRGPGVQIIQEDDNKFDSAGAVSGKERRLGSKSGLKQTNIPKPAGAGSVIQQRNRPQACGRYQDETRVIWINRMSHRKIRWRETRRENAERP